MGQPEKMNRQFLLENVLDEARKRIALIFDNFENIIVSISGGKDSTALFWLAVQEAGGRGRKIKAFFLDQEAEYQSSIDLIDEMVHNPVVEPLWFQVPLKLTNATSYKENLFYCWEEGKEWLREKHPLAIHDISEEYPDRFYSFFPWLEKKQKNTAFLVGLRTEESFNRVRAALLNPGWNSIRWSTKTKGKNTFRFYPIYDWGIGDVWRFIYENDLPYNSIYDKMYQANIGHYKNMRVSNLIHEKSFKCLGYLQVYEPETFDKLTKRLPGVHVASIYSKEKTVFSSDVLPKHFSTWGEYKNYLLKSTPLEHKDRFEKRFSRQPENEEAYRKQVRQLLLNDFENNLDIYPGKKNKDDLYQKWWDRL